MPREGNYPLPKFHFQVKFSDSEIEFGFTEVSGLDFETEVIEYREGNSVSYHKTKQPGLTKYSNVTCKRGTFNGDYEFYNLWRQTFKFQEGDDPGSQYRKTVTIELLDEEHNPIITWELARAWPSKIQSTDLKADANEVAIETMELVHEGLTIQTN